MSINRLKLPAREARGGVTVAFARRSLAGALGDPAIAYRLRRFTRTSLEKLCETEGTAPTHLDAEPPSRRLRQLPDG
jgi:hypothetical protein